MLKRKNIVLIGFMGSGKTAVGRQLAKNLKYALKDTDSIVEMHSGMKINDIFYQKGEAFFRDLENKTIKDLCNLEKQVISCGGGAILNKENVDCLKEKGVLIYLKAPFEVLYDRIKLSTNRPLLGTNEPEQTAKKLLDARQHVYEQVADLSVNTEERSIDEIVGKIIEKVIDGNLKKD